MRGRIANMAGGLVVLALLVSAPAIASAATVEVHYDKLTGSTYTRAGDFTSDFSPADNANGAWQLLPTSSGVPELGFVKTQNTGSGAVEVHLDTLSGSTYKRVADYGSDFRPADAANGHFILFGSANGAPELGFVKTRNTPGTVEVHYDVLSGGVYKRAGDFVSDFSLGDGPNGVWQLTTAPSGTAPVLGFIKVVNTGSHTVEVHWDTLQGTKYVRVGDARSSFNPADNANGVWHLISTSTTTPELGFIKLRNTGSGHIEGHWDALTSTGVFTPAGDHASDFSLADAGNGTWLFTATSGAPELGFVKTNFPAPPSTTPTQPPAPPVTVTLPVSKAKHHVRVRIRMSWSWRGRHTKLTKVTFGRMPRGATVAVRCRGKGCPRPQLRQTRARRARLFASILSGQRYRAGDRLFVTVRAPGLIAERAVIKIRNGRKPAVRAL